MRGRRAAFVAAVATSVAMIVTGCGPANPLASSSPAADAGITVTSPDLESPPVIPSAAFAGSVDAATQAGRIEQITEAVTALRAASTSGWQAQQSDLTGFARELSGGSFAVAAPPLDAAKEFVATFGSAFGPSSTFAFEIDPSSTPDATTVIATQVVGDIPVDGGGLVLAVLSGDDGSQVVSATGAAVDTTGAASTAAVDGPTAVRAVADAQGVTPSPNPLLLVLAHDGRATLAWAVTVDAGPTDATGAAALISYPATFFVDATTGTVIGARPVATSPRLHAAAQGGTEYARPFTLPPAGTPIVITRRLVDGTVVRANAERLANGSIALIDSTGPQANRTTHKGLIVAFDGARARNGDENGPVAIYARESDIPDDAVLTMDGLRKVLDYYANDIGRLSFDGRNSPVPVTINYTQGDACLDNAFFASNPKDSGMYVGVPCSDGGKQAIRTYADVTVMGHELTHGVTNTNSRFQDRTDIVQTAIDEGTADYFGVIIANKAAGKVSSTGFRTACYKIPTSWACRKFPDGSIGMRSINTGATMQDYASVLFDPLGLNIYGDDGHDNGMVWTNALWQARKAVASLDGGDLITSARAKLFDRAVNRATSSYLTGASDLADAAIAVQRAAGEVGLTGQERSLIADRFRASGLCKGCLARDAAFGLVSATGRVESRPSVAGNKVAFISFTGSYASSAKIATPGLSDVRDVLPKADLTVTLASRGDWVAQTQYTFANDANTLGLMNIATGKSETVATDIDVSVQPGVGSDGLAWAGDKGLVYYRPLTGGKPVAVTAPDDVARVATDDGLVAILTNSGALMVWVPSTGEKLDLDPVEAARGEGITLPGGGLAMWGHRLAVLPATLGVGEVLVYDLDEGTVNTLSAKAVGPLGVTMNDDLVVWSQVTGSLPGLINEITGDTMVDTALTGYSISADTSGRVADPRGQQGFPSLGDVLLAWQESSSGGQDISSARLQ